MSCSPCASLFVCVCAFLFTAGFPLLEEEILPTLAVFSLFLEGSFEGDVFVMSSVFELLLLLRLLLLRLLLLQMLFLLSLFNMLLLEHL